MMHQEGPDVADALIETQRGVRDDLVDTLSRELLGPSDGKNEFLRQRPTGRYLVGRLAPAGTKVSPEEDEGASDAGTGADDSETGYASPISMAMNPSSIGLSFTVGVEVRAVKITAEWGTYTEEKRDLERKDGSTIEVNGWVRTQHTHTCTIEVTDSGEHDIDGDVRIQWLPRRLPDRQRRAVSVFLVNRIRSDNPGRSNDSEWLFPAAAARLRS